MRGIFGVAMLLSAAGPVLAQDASAPAPAADANVFIYRDYAEPTVWAPTVKIDGRKVVAIGQNQYTALHVEPGTHRIQLAWPLLSGQSGKAGTITVEAGKTLYLEVTGISRIVGGGPTGLTALMGSGVEQRADAAEAIKACCKFKPPK